MGRVTPGFVGADLKALSREAGMLAVSRIVDADPDIRKKNIVELGPISRIHQSSNILDIIQNINSNEDKDKITIFETNQKDEVSNGNLPILSSTKDSSRMMIEESSPEVLGSAESSAEVSGNIEEKMIEIPCQQITNNQTVINDTIIDNSIYFAEKIRSTEQSREFVQIMVIKEHDMTAAAVSVEMRDFLSAAKSVQPSAKREGFAVVPDVTWGEFSHFIWNYDGKFLLQNAEEQH